MKVFANIMKFLGLTDTTKKVDLTEEQIEKIDTSLGELETIKTDRDGLKTKVTELEAAATTSATKITELTSQVQTLTTDKTKLEGEKTALEAKVAEVGKLDGGKFSKPSGKEEKKNEGETIEYSQSQKELMAKVDL